MPDGQFLIYPVTDQSHDFASYPLGGKDHLLTPALMGWFQSHYLSPQNRDHPDVSPLKASSLEGLPPAFIALSAFDILHHQGEQYAAKLAAAGVPVRVAAFPNMMHGFVNLLRYPEASQAAMECAEGLRELVAVIREKALVAPTPDQVSA
jgi:acetyl esterase